MEKTTKKKHKGLKITCAVLGAILILLGSFYLLGIPEKGKNPHHLSVLNAKEAAVFDSLTRLDSDGYLYTLDFTTADYNAFSSRGVPNLVKLVRKTGCTGFFTKETETGDYLLCRNFDYPHLAADGNTTGCSVAIKCAPKDGYRSIAFADAALMLEIGVQYVAGSLDDGKTDTSLLLSLPWLCMDGVNDQGLSASIMSIDPKEGEPPVDQNEPNKERVLVPELLRYILDSCKDVNEAIELAKSKNVVNAVGNMYHLFVNDAAGNSVVIEWRNNEMFVVESDAATNFYLSSDDAEDTYYGDFLKEAWKGPAVTQKEYHYGYGHGYERFKTVVTALDGKESLSFTEARDLLFATKQHYAGEHTSDSRYSVIYNLNNFTATVWSAENEQNAYTISFED